MDHVTHQEVDRRAGHKMSEAPRVTTVTPDTPSPCFVTSFG
jgi:hypothetical protein